MSARTDVDIAAFLAASPQSLGTIKTANMPDSPDEVGCVYETGGAPPDGGFGVAGVQFANPSVQVVFRGAPMDYATPRGKAQTAYLALKAVRPGVLSGVTGSGTYLTIDPQQQPLELRRDDAQRVYVGFNVLIKREP